MADSRELGKGKFTMSLEHSVGPGRRKKEKNEERNQACQKNTGADL